MARTLRVAVIGAGIGGLAAACALRTRGFEVAVYERAPSLGEVGAGLQLGPNAVKVLRALALETALRQLAFEPTSRSPGTMRICAFANHSRQSRQPNSARPI